MRRVHVAPLLAGLVLGCGIEFSAPLMDSTARLAVHLDLVDSLGVGQARLNGTLWPGFTSAGNLRFLVDSSLSVMGRSVAPSASASEAGSIPYEDQWGLDPDIPPGEVELRAPEIPGTLVGPPVVRLTPPWRSGPSEVTVASGSPLKLDLIAHAVPDSAVRESWRVELLSDDGRYAGAISTTGATPATVEVPWELVAGMGAHGKVFLWTQQYVGPEGSGYDATFLVTTRHV